MRIESVYHHIPVQRLRDDLIGRHVAIELLLLDNRQSILPMLEERYLENSPSRQPTQAEVRDFTALHYTPLLKVWNKDATGWSGRAGAGTHDNLSPAVRLLSLTTMITAFKEIQPVEPDVQMLALVEVENTAGVAITFPLCPSLDQGQQDTLAMTITDNPETRRREYAVRMYNVVVVFAPLD